MGRQQSTSWFVQVKLFCFLKKPQPFEGSILRCALVRAMVPSTQGSMFSIEVRLDPDRFFSAPGWGFQCSRSVLLTTFAVVTMGIPSRRRLLGGGGQGGPQPCY